MSIVLQLVLFNLVISMLLVGWWAWLNVVRRRYQELRALVLKLDELVSRDLYGRLTSEQQVEYDLTINDLRRLTDERQ